MLWTRMLIAFWFFASGVLSTQKAAEQASVTFEEASPAPEIIVPELRSYRAGDGQDVSFSVSSAYAVNTTEPLTFSWFVDGEVVLGETSPLLWLRATAGVMNRIRARVTCGPLERFSNEAELVGLPPPEARLLLHLDFEEIRDNQLIDSTGLNTNIFIHGDFKLGPGRIGNSAVFDGSWNAVVPAAGTDLELIGTSYTISWWMKRTAAVSGSVYWRDGMFDVAYAALLSSASLRTYHATRLGNPMGMSLVTLLPDWTNWTHVAIVFDGTDWSAFTNGVMANSQNPSGKLSANENDLLIGSGSGFAMDDFRIYTYALASDEIFTLASPPSQTVNLQISKTSEKAVLRWQNINGRFRVEYSTILSADTIWIPLSDPIDYSGDFSEIEQPLTAEKRYYRLRML